MNLILKSIANQCIKPVDCKMYFNGNTCDIVLDSNKFCLTQYPNKLENLVKDITKLCVKNKVRFTFGFSLDSLDMTDTETLLITLEV